MCRNAYVRWVATFVAGVMLASCGGGGGGGNFAANPTAEFSNRAEAEAVLISVFETSEIAEALILDLVVDGSAMASATAAAAEDDSVIVVSPTAVQNCSGGGTADVFENGLRVDFTFVDCIDFVYTNSTTGQQIQLDGYIDGGLSVVVSSQSSSETDFVADVILNNLTIIEDNVTSNADGTITIDYLETASAITITVSIDSAATFTFDGQMRTLRKFSVTATANSSQESRYGGGQTTEATAFSGTAVFNIPVNTPFIQRLNEARPYTGLINIDGANDRRIRVTAEVDSQSMFVARILLDLDGDGTFEDIYTKPWDELLPN